MLLKHNNAKQLYSIDYVNYYWHRWVFSNIMPSNTNTQDPCTHSTHTLTLWLAMYKSTMRKQSNTHRSHSHSMSLALCVCSYIIYIVNVTCWLFIVRENWKTQEIKILSYLAWNFKEILKFRVWKSTIVDHLNNLKRPV